MKWCCGWCMDGWEVFDLMMVVFCLLMDVINLIKLKVCVVCLYIIKIENKNKIKIKEKEKEKNSIVIWFVLNML